MDSPELFNETNGENDAAAASEQRPCSQRRAMLRAIAATPLILTITSGTALAQNESIYAKTSEPTNNQPFRRTRSRRWWEDDLYADPSADELP